MAPTNAGGSGGGSPAPTPSRWQVAVHEAAHAAYAHRQGIGVPRVTVEGIVAIEDGGERSGSFGRCHCDDDGEAEVAFEGLMGCVLSLVGPAAAFRAGWPEPLLPYSEFVRDAEASNPRSDDGTVLALLRSAGEPEKLYEAARAKAEAFVDKHWAEVVALAGRLMEAETLSGSDVSSVLGPGWAEFREMLDEMRLRDDIAPWVFLEGGEMLNEMLDEEVF